MGVPLLKGFPPQFYDMNLIEVIWGQLEQKLLGKRHTKKKEYEKEVRGAWEEVKQTTIDRLVAKHPQQLKRIKARYAVLAIPGNHDYYAGYERFLEVARRSNITVLRNERLVFAGAIQVAGLDEPAGRSFAEGGPNLEKALAGNDPDRPTILLAHRPDGFLRAVARKIDLQLSGHTHAGQIPPLEELYWVIYPYSSGYYEKDGSRLYTSCGTGTWGPPMRLLSRNEIVRFTLVRKPSA